MNNISLLVGLKNNLEYNKSFYNTTRELYPEIEICFVSYGSNDGTHEWLDSLNDKNLKYFYSNENKTFSDTFNKATELSSKEYVIYLHNDIILSPGFIENIEKHMGVNNIVSYTTVEPPIFSGHERPGKIIRDFGTDLDSFDKIKFREFSFNECQINKDKIEPGVTFFMCSPKAKLIEIGGLDSLFNPMFCEDDDLIKRFKLYGLNLFTSLDAICYHFVSKTSRFSEEYQSKTQQIELHSNRNFFRKWGSKSCDVKYNIAFVVKKCNSIALASLEPWCDRIYIDDDMKVITSHYIDHEQKYTDFDLNKRIFNIGYNDPLIENDIIVEFDVSLASSDSFNIITQLPNIIKESGEIGTFTVDIFKITINALTEYQNELIFISKINNE